MKNIKLPQDQILAQGLNNMTSLSTIFQFFFMSLVNLFDHFELKNIVFLRMNLEIFEISASRLMLGSSNISS